MGIEKKMFHVTITRKRKKGLTLKILLFKKKCKIYQLQRYNPRDPDSRRARMFEWRVRAGPGALAQMCHIKLWRTAKFALAARIKTKQTEECKM